MACQSKCLVDIGPSLETHPPVPEAPAEERTPHAHHDPLAGTTWGGADRVGPAADGAGSRAGEVAEHLEGGCCSVGGQMKERN